jgi:hypothetical protein
MTERNENPKRASAHPERATPLSSVEHEHQLLLGRPCRPGTREDVIRVLSIMDPEKRSIVYEWAMFPLDDLPFMAYDRIKTYREQDPKRDNKHAQEATTDYLDGMISWLDLARVSDKVPVLEYEEPEDKIGEEADWFEWTLDDGGASNQLLAEQIEYMKDHLGKYKEQVEGKRKTILLPVSIERNLPQETREEKIRLEQERTLELVAGLLEKLAPHKKHLDETLVRLGIDPVTYEDIKK